MQLRTKVITLAILAVLLASLGVGSVAAQTDTIMWRYCRADRGLQPGRRAAANDLYAIDASTGAPLSDA